jgi:hypothetical protein
MSHVYDVHRNTCVCVTCLIFSSFNQNWNVMMKFVKIVCSSFQNLPVHQLVHGDRHCNDHFLWEGIYTAVNKLCSNFKIVDIFGGCQESEICTATKLYASWLRWLGRAVCAWGPATLRTAEQQDLVTYITSDHDAKACPSRSCKIAVTFCMMVSTKYAMNILTSA